LKKSKDTSDIPIISLSERADVSIIKKVIALGCYNFILKPFDEETLIRKALKVTPHYVSEYVAQKEMGNKELLGEGEVALNWTDDFEIGIKEIDDEHRKIIEEYGMLYSKMKDGIGHDYYQELLAFLVEYVSTHFAHEEKLQEEIGYDKCAEHKKIHDKFKMYVNEMIEKNKNNPATDMDLIRINLFIKDWLIHHILITDKKIEAFLHKGI
jgi:hemerythrin